MNINRFEDDNKIEIKSTSTSPHFYLDKKNGLIKIFGNSILENSKPFYNLILKDIEQYLNNTDNISILSVYIHFIYINTQAIKEIINLFSLLENSGKALKIVWYYSDEEILDLGLQLEELSQIIMEKKRIDTEANFFEKKP